MRSFLALALLLTAMFSSSKADITWNVTFEDGASSEGFGTGHALGATRRATFQAALDYISATLDTPNDVTLDYVVETSLTMGTGPLASGGTLFFNSTGFTNGVLFQHAQTGTDPLAGQADGSAQFDFGYNWNSENDAPTAGEFDLYTVAVHEVTHSLGYLSLTGASGNSVFGGNPGTYSVTDSFLERGDGTDLFAAGGNFIGNAADLISDDVFFNGANAMAANGGAPVKMYAPNPFASGSSLSHVDTATFGNAISAHSIAPGVKKTNFIPVELGILQDIGWQLQSPVPEPGSLGILGLCVGGLLFRRRR